jgi:hypothetical protein
MFFCFGNFYGVGEMDEKTKQKICIKFCCKTGKSAAETLELLKQAFRDHAFGKSAVCMGYAR